MTTQADQKDTTRRSRRKLLAGGTSAPAAVLAAEAITRPVPAHASAQSGTAAGSFLGRPNGAHGVTDSSGGVGAAAVDGTDSGSGPRVRGVAWLPASRVYLDRHVVLCRGRTGGLARRGLCAWGGGSGCVFC